MLKPEFTGQFKRDYKLALKRGCDPKKLNEVVMLLCKEEPLPEAYRDHALVNSRNYKGMRESHYISNWVYESGGRRAALVGKTTASYHNVRGVWSPDSV